MKPIIIILALFLSACSTVDLHPCEQKYIACNYDSHSHFANNVETTKEGKTRFYGYQTKPYGRLQ